MSYMDLTLTEAVPRLSQSNLKEETCFHSVVDAAARGAAVCAKLSTFGEQTTTAIITE
jgi:hypothetical protein